MTYKISLEQSFDEYSRNEAFREAINSGAFVYMENSYVLNAPPFIQLSEAGRFELTDYAKHNLSECALAFTDRMIIKYSGTTMRGLKSDELMHGGSRVQIEERQIAEYDRNTQNEKLFTAIQEAEEAMKIADKLPNPFGQALAWLMKWRKTTNERLAEATLMSSRTIQRMRTNPEPNYEAGTVVAVCVGLQLFPHISHKMLAKAGIKLKDTKKDIYYSIFINTHYKSSVHECNQLLLSNNLSPLTRDE